MKRVLFILALVFVSMVGMAQHHHGGPAGHGPKEHHGQPPRHETRYVAPSSPEQLAMVLRVIDNQSFDDNRLEIAKLSVCLGHFFVRDMAQMASRFSFDDKRKEFLIYAYPFCLDPENYYTLKDVFKFHSNFEETMEAVLPGYKR